MVEGAADLPHSGVTQRPALCRAFSPDIVGESVFPALRTGLVCCRAFGAPQENWIALICSASGIYPYLTFWVSEPANLRADSQRVYTALPDVSRRYGASAVKPEKCPLFSGLGSGFSKGCGQVRSSWPQPGICTAGGEPCCA